MARNDRNDRYFDVSNLVHVKPDYVKINSGCVCKNKYERYYGPGRRPSAYLLYYTLTVSPACALIFTTTLHRRNACSEACML